MKIQVLMVLSIPYICNIYSYVQKWRTQKSEDYSWTQDLIFDAMTSCGRAETASKLIFALFGVVPWRKMRTTTKKLLSYVFFQGPGISSFVVV